MRIFLGIIGFLLLIPGVCGAVSYGVMWAELLNRGSWSFRDYDGAFWIFALPSLNLGLLGFWLLAKSAAADWMVRAAPLVAYVALALNLAVVALLAAQPGAFDEKIGDTLSLSAIFLMTWLPGGLALLQLRKRT